MRRFWAFICMICSMLVVVLFNAQAVIGSKNLSLEYDGGREAVFALTERENGKELNISDISEQIMNRLDVAGAKNSEVEVTKSDENHSSYKARVKVSTKTQAEYDNIIRVVKSNTTLSVSTATDEVVLGSELFSKDQIMQLDYEGITPVPSFIIEDTQNFKHLKDRAAEAEDENLKKTLYVWENKTEEDTYDKAFGKENGREDVKKKIIATLNVDDFNEETGLIKLNADENNNPFTISSARSYVAARNVKDYGFDVEMIYDNIVGPSYREGALLDSMIGFGVALLLLFIGLIVFYGWSGVISSVSILVGSMIQLMVFSFLGFEFTPITIGAMLLMLVLATFVQVSYFERVKSELAKGRNIVKANSEGYRKSFWTTLDACGVVFFTSLLAFALGQGMVKTFSGVGLIGSLVVFLVVNYLTKWMMYWMVSTPMFNTKNNTFGLKINEKSLVNKMKDKEFINYGKTKKKTAWSFGTLLTSLVILTTTALVGVFAFGPEKMVNTQGNYGTTYRIDTKFVTSRALSEDSNIVDITNFYDEISADQEDEALKNIKDNVLSSTFNRKETLDKEYVETYTTYVSLELKNPLTDSEFDALKTRIETFDCVAGYDNEVEVTNSIGKSALVLHNNNNMYLVLGTTIIFASLYFLVRYGIAVALSTLLTSTTVTAGFVALITICRIPLNSTSLFGVLIGLMILSILYVAIFARNKELVKENKRKHLTSEQYSETLNEAIKFSIVPVLMTVAATIVLALTFLGFGGLNVLAYRLFIIAFVIIGGFSIFLLSIYFYQFFKSHISLTSKGTLNKWRHRKKKPVVQEVNEPCETIVPGIND